MGTRLERLVAPCLVLLALASGRARADESCRARAAALQARLTADGHILGLNHPGVGRVLGGIVIVRQPFAIPSQPGPAPGGSP